MMKYSKIKKLIAGASLLFSSYVCAELVLIVHPENPVDSLELTHVVDIYTGRYVAFPNGTSAEPIDLPNSSQDKADFYKKATGLSLAKISSYWARLKFTGRYMPPTELATASEVVNFVAKNPKAIGYVEESEVDSSVKVVYRF
ncbi:hypothetical protein [Catenovulum sediminis]|uniref:Phosphate ABC transporter substrate-binding protein n=1 Tax=Catenovulum sediminis TaxID=1740262 RepID=A0ABV1RDK9_9ALTE|nr:hypothetical protein [Catenovulum sediminis]